MLVFRRVSSRDWGSGCRGIMYVEKRYLTLEISFIDMECYLSGLSCLSRVEVRFDVGGAWNSARVVERWNCFGKIWKKWSV